MNDLVKTMSLLAQIERLTANGRRYGRVFDVKPGKIRVRFDKQELVTGDGLLGLIGGGEQEEPFLSPWIRTSEHEGFVNEHIPYEKGQGVYVDSANGDFTQATVHPHTFSRHNPMDGKAALDAHTQRIRKPRQDVDPNQEEIEVKQDDPNDLQVTRKHDLFRVEVYGSVFEMGPGFIRANLGGTRMEMTPDHFQAFVGSTGVNITGGSVAWTK